MKTNHTSQELNWVAIYPFESMTYSKPDDRLGEWMFTFAGNLVPQMSTSKSLFKIKSFVIFWGSPFASKFWINPRQT